MLEKGFNCDLEYISKVHQNPKAPQNHNILISNLRSGLFKIFDECRWKTVRDTYAYEEILCKCHTFLLEQYAILKREGYRSRGFENLLNAMDKDCPKTYIDRYTNIKLKLYNDQIITQEN